MDRPADIDAVISLMQQARHFLEQRTACSLSTELHQDLAQALGSLQEAIERHDPTPLTWNREVQRVQGQASQEAMRAIIAVAVRDDEDQRQEASRRQEELRQRQEVVVDPNSRQWRAPWS